MAQEVYICRIMLQIDYPHVETSAAGGLHKAISDIVETGCVTEGYTFERIRIDMRTDDLGYIVEEII